MQVKLTVTLPNNSIKIEKSIDSNAICYLDHNLFTGLHKHCNSDYIDQDFRHSVRFIDYKGNNIVNLSSDRNHNQIPDPVKNPICNIPMQLSKIKVPYKNASETSELPNTVIVPITNDYKIIANIHNRKKQML